MNAAVSELCMHALMLTVLFSAVPLLTSMLLGLFISVLQASTQIQEQTLSFIPKLTATIVVLFLFGPLAIEYLVDFGANSLEELTSIAMED